MLTRLSAHACERYPRGTTGPVQQRRIGDTPVSAIGLGAMPLSTKTDRPSREDAVATVHAALDVGVTLVDTADAYAADESEFGHNEELVAAALASYGGDTSSVLVATKGGHTRRGTDWELDGSPSYLRRACEDSLRRLGVDAVDLYLLHWPHELRLESWGVLEQLHAEGLARSIGVSNFLVRHLDELLSRASEPPAVNQIELSPFLFRSREDTVRRCAEEGIVIEAYSPLTKGRRLNDRTVVTIAAEVGRTPAQVLIRWSVQKDFVVLAGSSNPDHVRENAAVFDFTLDDSQMAALDALDEGLTTGWDPATQA